MGYFVRGFTYLLLAGLGVWQVRRMRYSHRAYMVIGWIWVAFWVVSGLTLIVRAVTSL